MKVAVLSQYFVPEPCAAANRIEALAGALAAAGHDTTVVTAFPSFPARKLRGHDRFRFVARDDANGANVVRLLTMHFGTMPGARLLHWLVSSAAMTCYMLLTRERFDTIVVSSPPITLTLPALAGAWRHRAKLIADIRDVYPDVAVAMGEWHENSLLVRAVRGVARMLYRQSRLIVTVTPATVTQILSAGADPSRVVLAANGADDANIARAIPGNGSFIAVYAGNLGLATDVDVLVDAANALKDDRRFSIRIVGDGAQAARMRERIQAAGLKNISLLGALPRDHALHILAAANVALVPLRAGITDSIPSKIFDAFSVGCPVIVAADGEAASIAQRSDAGVAVPAGNAEALAAALRSFSGLSRETQAAAGERGRAFVRRFYGRRAIMDGLCIRIAEC